MLVRARGSALAAVVACALSCGQSPDADPQGLTLAALADPSPEFRPWVRYWWPGGAVNDAQILEDVAHIAGAGFGGVELQAFDAALDPSLREAAGDPVAIGPAFAARVETLARAAADAGLRLDLTAGSGWPLGHHSLGPDRALTTLMWAEKTASGPADLDWALEPTPTVFFTVAQIAETTFGERLARFVPSEAELLRVVAAPLVSGARSSSILDVRDTVVLDRGRAVDLTDVVSGGRLRWSVPAGRWHIVAVFAGPDGEYITLTAERGDPYPVDPLNADAVRVALAAWTPTVPAGVTGVFSDSLELKADRIFTHDFLEEFERRRGYPLGVDLLVTLAQAADSFLIEAGQVEVAPEFAFAPERDEEVRWDYEQTVSDLFVDGMLAGAQSWAQAHGLTFRSQSYGIDVDVVEAAGAVDVPEAETLYAGGSEMFLRAISAAGGLYGREIVAAEAFSFIERDHMTTPLKIRAVTDKLLASGINRLVFHGYPYPAEGDYGVTGWTPFSSPFGGATTFASTFGPQWEFWDDLPALTRYASRGQLLMRAGTPDADVLVLLPFRGFPTSLALQEDHLEPLLGGHLPDAEPVSRDVPFADVAAVLGPPTPDARARWLVALWPVLEELERSGFSWSWISAGAIDQVVPHDGRLVVGDVRVPTASYAHVLVFDTEAVPARVAGAVERWAGAGVPVTIAGTLPSRSPSYGEGSAGDARVAQVFGGLSGARVAATPEAVVTRVEGFIRPSAWATAPTPQRATLRYRDGSPLVALFRNPSFEPSAAEWRVPGCAPAVLYDAWEHEATAVDAGALRVELAPYASVFLLCDTGAETAVRARLSQGMVIPEWTIEATRAAPGPSVTVTVEAPLPDWRDVPELAGMGGRARFSSEVALEAPCDAVLEFERVAGAVWFGTARVSMPPWRLPIGRLETGLHHLQFEYVPPIRNEVVALGEAGDPRYGQHAGAGGLRVRTGVEGTPVLRCAQ